MEKGFSDIVYACPFRRLLTRQGKGSNMFLTSDGAALVGKVQQVGAEPKDVLSNHFSESA